MNNGSTSLKLSIALATYNGEKFLSAQLESFLCQRRLPDEVIVFDDASTDSTLQLLRRFKDKAPFKVQIYVNSTAVGHEQNFGRAIEKCSGDIIFLSDQDDVWYPEKISVVSGLFARDPNVKVLINDLDICDRDLNRTGNTVLQQLKASGTLGKGKKSHVLGCASSFRASLKAIVIPVPDLKYGHDKWLHQIGNILDIRMVLPIPLQAYRRHGANASSWIFDGPNLVSWRDMVAPTKGLDMTPAYRKELQVINEIKHRIEILSDADWDLINPSARRSRFLSKLSCAQESISSRIALNNSGWLTRKLLAIHMLFTRKYHFFLGIRSFLKDFSR